MSYTCGSVHTIFWQKLSSHGKIYPASNMQQHLKRVLTCGQCPTFGSTTNSSTTLKSAYALPSSTGSHGSLSPQATKTGHWPKKIIKKKEEDKISKKSFKLDINIMVSQSAVHRSSANLHFWEQLFGKGAFRVADELEEYICCARSKSWLQNYLNQLICYCRCIVITLQRIFTRLIIGWAEKRHHFIKRMWMTTIDGS